VASSQRKLEKVNKMKEELLKLLESKGFKIKFEGIWTGEEQKDTAPTISELFENDVIEGASEGAITKAILGVLAYLTEHSVENVKQRVVTTERYNDKIRIYLTSHWLGSCVPVVTLENESSFTISKNPEPRVKWADGGDWGVAFVGYLELT
jgi:hypothetical protein